MSNNRFVIKMMSLFHRVMYRLSRGRIGGRIGKAPLLLLTTTGRKTGKQRTTPLIYVRRGDHFAVVASNAGDDKSPAWWMNLTANPAGTIQVRGARHQVTARQAEPAERTALFPEFVAIYRAYADYERRTARAIPVVILAVAKPTE